MFDFEKLVVYQKAKSFNKEIYQFIKFSKTLDRTTKDQLRRASFSIMLNIAEGTSRFSKADRRNKELQLAVYRKAEELSKMLFTMIKSYWRVSKSCT